MHSLQIVLIGDIRAICISQSFHFFYRFWLFALVADYFAVDTLALGRIRSPTARSYSRRYIFLATMELVQIRDILGTTGFGALPFVDFGRQLRLLCCMYITQFAFCEDLAYFNVVFFIFWVHLLY